MDASQSDKRRIDHLIGLRQKNQCKRKLRDKKISIQRTLWCVWRHVKERRNLTRYCGSTFHFDMAKMIPNIITDDHNNPSNLQEIIKFLATYGNNANFNEHMTKIPKTATYRSKTTQNEILAICVRLLYLNCRMKSTGPSTFPFLQTRQLISPMSNKCLQLFVR